MPLTDAYARVPLTSIIVKREERQRREVSTKGLKESIARNGVISPVIVDRLADREDGQPSYLLIAGERRLASCFELGLATIPIRLASELSPIEREILELEENAKRSDLTWRESVRATARIHELLVAKAEAEGESWSQTQTGEWCSLDPSVVSIYLKVWGSFDDPYVAQAGTVKEAQNILLRREQRAMGNALEALISGERLDDYEDERSVEDKVVDGLEMVTVSPARDYISGAYPAVDSIYEKIASTPLPPEPIRQADFLTWAPAYEGRKFNLIHCDFPYGVGLFSANGVRSGPNRSQMGQDEGEVYDDDPETYKRLVECLASNLDRLMSISGHLMFWYSAKVEIDRWTRDCFARLAPSISWTRFPLIWLKSDNAGIAASPNYEPRHIYETCLLGSRGKRQIVKIVSDAYSAPTDKSIHSSAKPEPMLRHFMTMLVDGETNLLDPTCGSGTALRAAESLGARSVLGLERDPKMVEMALRALKAERAKRKLAREF